MISSEHRRDLSHSSGKQTSEAKLANVDPIVLNTSNSAPHRQALVLQPTLTLRLRSIVFV